MSYFDDLERDAKAEAFREDLERRYRDDPDYWAWYEKRAAALRLQSQNERQSDGPTFRGMQYLR